MPKGLGISQGLLEEVMTLIEVDEFLIVPETEMKHGSIRQCLMRFRQGVFAKYGFPYPDGWELRTLNIEGVKTYIMRVA